MGLDGQVQVKTRELENVFFFLLQKLTSPFFQERLQIYIVVASVIRWPEGKMSEGATFFPATSFRGLTLERGWISTSTATN